MALDGSPRPLFYFAIILLPLSPHQEWSKPSRLLGSVPQRRGGIVLLLGLA
ncbi:MAG: hypothetical protein ACJ72X_14250 [Nitrososphaeraceae archaeon]